LLSGLNTFGKHKIFRIPHTDSINVTAKIKNTNCKTPDIGSITLTVDGGSGNYDFSWSNGSNTQDIFSLVAGTYTVTITDNSDPNNKLIQAFNVRVACLDFKKEVVSEPFMDSDSTYTVTYRINLSNSGEIDITNLSINDSLDITFDPSKAFYGDPYVISENIEVQSDYDGSGESSYVVLGRTLTVGQDAYIDIVVRVEQLQKGQTFTNTAYYDFDYDGGDGAGSAFFIGASNEAPVKFLDRPEIQITKTALTPNVDAVNDTINYIIEVKNTGNTILTNVVVTDSLTGLLRNISTLAVGTTVTMTTVYTVTQEDLDMGVITNTVTVTGYFEAIEVSDSTSVNVPVIQQPLLSLLKKSLDSTYKKPGEIIDYELLITNLGNVTLTDVFIDDPLAEYTYTVSSLPVNETITLTTTYTVTQVDLNTGFILNTATATTEFGADVITDSDDDILYGEQLPGLSIQKTARPIVYKRFGELITYDIAVTNTGNVTLTNILVQDPLTSLSQTISSLSANETYTITTTYGVKQADLDAGSVLNIATAASTFSTTVVTDSDDEKVNGLKLPAIAILKKAQKPTYNKNGEVVLYDLIVSNTGNVSLYDVLVNDTLTKLSTTIPFIASGGFQVVTTSYRITQADILTKSVINTATASGIFYGQSLFVSDDELILSSQKPPVAIDDSKTTLVSVKTSGNILVNDSDPDGDPILVTEFLILGKLYSPGSTVIIEGVGTILINANGTYVFTPTPTFVGQVPPIRYTITDGIENFARAVLRITVIPLANPPQLILADTSICENEIAVLTVNSKNVENPVYTWYADSSLTSLVFTGSTYKTSQLKKTTSYYVKLDGSNIIPTLPIVSGKVTVTVLPLPAKPTLTVRGKTILCPGDSTTITSTEASSYQWYKNGILIIGETQQSIQVKDAGSYTVKNVGSNGCISDVSDNVNITISPIPEKPTLASDKQLYCAGDTALIESSSSSVNYWFFNDLRLTGDSGKSVKTTLPGKYTVITKNQNGCFSTFSNSITISFNDVPVKPNVTIDGTLIFCEGDYRILKTTIPAGHTLQWYRDGILMDGKTKDTLRITVGGKYTARFINASGCSSPFSDCICTEIKCETGIYTPDIFTPNNDEINDVLKPSIPGIRKFVCFKVYNRWGNLVFYTTDPKKGWDGKYKGLNQPAETYMWIVEGFDSSGKKIKKSGMLSLMR
jgi:gliding motility-associated-like protein/uncharacterized repeat protein (TIGR01451 family)